MPSANDAKDENLSSPKKASGSGCLMIFGLPFFLVGLFVLGLAVRHLWDAYRIESWEPVPMTILSAELEVHHGDDSTSYQAVATYRYTWQEREYTGERVGLSSGGDNIGSWQQQKARILEDKAATGEPVRGLVNPENPREAILFPEIRWGHFALMFGVGLVFGSVGLGLLVWGTLQAKTGKKTREQAGKHPHEPWKWREDWSTGRIESSDKTGFILILVMAFIWNALSWPAVIAVFMKEEPLKVLLLVGIFPLVGLFLLAGAIYQGVRHLKYGKSIFEMGSVPGVIGGRLSGMVQTRVGLRPEEGFHVTLSCVRRERSGSGNNRSTTERILWQNSRVIRKDAMAHDRSRSAIPILFAIPYDQPPSDPEGGHLGVFWRLEVRAKVPGVDYATQFTVPVFKTEDSDPEFQVDESALRDYVLDTPPQEDLRRAGVKVEGFSGAGMIYRFPPARNKGMAAGLTVMTAIFCGVAIGLPQFGAPVFFAIIFGIFGLLLLMATFHAWFGWAEIRLDNAKLTLKNGVLLYRKTVELQSGEIAEIDLERGMQSGNRLHYQVIAKTRDGQRHRAGLSLPSQHLAGVLRDELNARLGLPQEG